MGLKDMFLNALSSDDLRKIDKVLEDKMKDLDMNDKYFTKEYHAISTVHNDIVNKVWEKEGPYNINPKSENGWYLSEDDD